MTTTDISHRTAAEIGPDLAVALTELLSENWYYRPSDSDYHPEEHGHLVLGDLRIRMETSRYGKDHRVILVGDLSHLGGDYDVRYGLDLGEITVADTRSPAAIAKEINRRLLPVYRASFRTSRERFQAEQVRTRAMETAATIVLAAAGPEAIRRENTIYPHLNGVYRVSSYGDGADWKMELTDLSVETTVKILEMIRAEASS